MLNGRYTAVFISAGLHLLILIALIYSSANNELPLKKIDTKPAIKSYIYRPVKPPTKAIVIPQVKPKTEAKKINITKPKIETPKPDEKKQKNTEETTKVTQPNSIKKAPIKVNTAEIKEDKKLLAGPPLPDSPKKTKLSPRDRLSRLRSSINNSLVNDAYKEHTQIRSASIMDGDQIPVPHSTKQFTAEEVYKKNTVRSGHNTITKNKNGGCTIHREQMIGSPIEATTSGFACGESEFDKNFREHMQKVRDKTMPRLKKNNPK